MRRISERRKRRRQQSSPSTFQPPRVQLCTQYVMTLAVLSCGRPGAGPCAPSGDQPAPPVRSCPSTLPPAINIPISSTPALSPNGLSRRPAAAGCPVWGGDQALKRRGRSGDVQCLTMRRRNANVIRPMATAQQQVESSFCMSTPGTAAPRPR